MDKASVVAIRKALLRDEKDRAVRVVFDNGVVLSSGSDIIFWDDDKELIVALTSDSDGGSYSANLPIRVITSTYEHIQFIMSNTNTDKLDDTLGRLTSLVNISDEQKAEIKKWYDRVYGLYELSDKNYDPVDIIRD